MDRLVLYTILIQLLPFAAFTVLILTGRKLKFGPYLSIGAMTLALVLSIMIMIKFAAGELAPIDVSYEWFTIPGYDPISIGFLIDPLSILMLVIVTAVSLATQVYSLGYLKGEARLNWFYAAMSLFTFAMLAFVAANNFIQMLIAWELVGLCSYFLIGFWFTRDYVPPAASKAMVVTRIADFPMILGVMILFYYVGSFAYAPSFEIVATLPSGTITLIAILLFIGAIGKSAQFPLHTWLPDAMAGPSPVSALIHAATMVAAGVYLVARVFPIFELSTAAMATVAIIGAFTAFFAATIGMATLDIKRIVAYSTMSQLGYMMAALGVGSITASMFHLTTHAFFKAMLFLAAGAVIHALHTQNIFDMGGVRRRMKLSFIAFVIGALALAGVPPMSGFWSKDMILAQAWDKQEYLVFGLGLFTVFITAFYIFRLLFVTFTGKMSEIVEKHGHESPPVMWGPFMVLAAVTILIGIAGIPIGSWAGLGHWMGEFLAASGGNLVHESNIVVIMSVSAALIGILLAYLIYYAKAFDLMKLKALDFLRHGAQNRWYIDEIYDHTFVRPTFSLSKASLTADLRGVDWVVNGVARLVMGSGIRIRVIQTGYLQNYATAMFIALALMVLVLGFAGVSS